MTPGSSRRKYSQYRERLRADRKASNTPTDAKPEKKPRRTRSFGELLGSFIGLLRGHQMAIGFGLATLTVATMLKLLPPLATKLVIDNVLADQPIADSWLNRLPLPTDRYALLYVVGAGVALVSLLATAIHLSGRWYATKVSNKLTVSIRRRVFAHAVRLPLNRVYELKSGGATSLLRDDAGGISELVFSMLYNPWRAIIQLLGSLLVLLWVDWRMTLGGLLLVPAVYLTHRTWINRIRPLYRDIRSQRQDIDGQTTEAFGGMRVVRTYGRERSEANRFVNNNHVMIRQQLYAWCWTRVVEVIWEVLIPIASIGLLLYGGQQVLQGSLTIGDLTMFLIYLTMLLGPLATLANSATTFQNNLAGLDRVLDVLQEPLETSHTPPTEALGKRGRADLVSRRRFFVSRFEPAGAAGHSARRDAGRDDRARRPQRRRQDDTLQPRRAVL
jgi:ATP-binding cassette subfamily B protein